jgi:hypothetical protein
LETKETGRESEANRNHDRDERVSVDSLLQQLVRDPQAVEAAKQAAEEAREKSLQRQRARRRQSSRKPQDSNGEGRSNATSDGVAKSDVSHDSSIADPDRA